jgi:hypothetical protein
VRFSSIYWYRDTLKIVGLKKLPRRIIHVQKDGGIEGIKKIIMAAVQKELYRTNV